MNNAKCFKAWEDTAEPLTAGERARSYQYGMMAHRRAKRAEQERDAMAEQLALVMQFVERQHEEQAAMQKCMTQALCMAKTRCEALLFDLSKVANECARLRAMLDEASRVPPPLLVPCVDKTCRNSMDSNVNKE